jgi:hypothetical protein
MVANLVRQDVFERKVTPILPSPAAVPPGSDLLHLHPEAALNVQVGQVMVFRPLGNMSVSESGQP